MAGPTREPGLYYVRDILIEFVNDSASLSPVDKDGSNLVTMGGHGGADAERGGIRDTDAEEVSPPVIENDIPS